jgi:hypothetical protein
MQSASLCAEQGFVRTPKAWLRLPMSPGAARLIQIFCGYADDEGKSWYLYEELGEIMGRSKAAISGYVSELRQLGLIETVQKKFRNGYNAGLSVFIIGWRDMVQTWASMARKRASRSADADPTPASRATRTKSRNASPAPKQEVVPVQTRVADADLPNLPSQADAAPNKMEDASPSAAANSDQQIECRVQNSEYKDPTGLINNIQSTKTPRGKPRVVWSDEDEREWRSIRPGEDLDLHSGQRPNRELLIKAIQRAEDLPKTPCCADGLSAVQRATQALSEFAEKRDISYSDDDLHQAATALAKIAVTEPQLRAAMDELGSMWKPHWRHLSKPRQLCAAVEPAIANLAPSVSLSEQQKTIGNRAWAARIWLKQIRARDV